ncbi:hypothetical protein M0802_009119 [Mischocyttarus mexicanus]|nr:hypothetical protein M0802_009119 [Mischocyttarus mexicanus]
MLSVLSLDKEGRLLGQVNTLIQNKAKSSQNQKPVSEFFILFYDTAGNGRRLGCYKIEVKTSESEIVQVARHERSSRNKIKPGVVGYLEGTKTFVSSRASDIFVDCNDGGGSGDGGDCGGGGG